jgi:virginiamycin B lyase
MEAAMRDDRPSAILVHPRCCEYQQSGRARGNKLSVTVPALRAIRVVVLVAAVSALWLPASAGAYVYWANYNPSGETTIGRAGLDGTGVNQSFITATGGLIEIAVDGQHIYWPNTLAGTIGRANLDGTGVNQFFITGASDPEGLAVDGQHIYWTTYNGPGNTGIGRANLDGSAVDNTFITGGSNPGWVALDGQYIYWTNPSGGSIGRADLDGTSVNQSFISLMGVPGPDAVAVDGRHIYWTSDSPGAIARANLDGTALNKSFISAGDAHPYGVAVDGQHVYWTNLVARTVGRANLDGSSPDPGFITGRPAYVSAVAVDSLPHPTATSVACSPATPTLPASTSCTATVTDTATLGAPTGTVAFSATGLGSFGAPASCVLAAAGAAQSVCQLSFTPSLAGAQTITASYAGDVMHAASSGAASLTVLAAPSSFVPPPARPSNSFALSRPKLDKRNGSAILIATVPGAGALRLTGRGIRQLTRLASHVGPVKLTIKGQPAVQRRLGRTGKATVTVRVTYAPTGGDPNTESKKLTLRRGRR